MNSVLIYNQIKTFEKTGQHERIKATLRFDDQCKNGHNTFSMTANIDEKTSGGHWRDSMGGMCHDEIVKAFPDLKKYIK